MAPLNNMFSRLGTLEKQVLSAIFTFIVLSFFVGWQVSALFVVAVGFHESCHILAAKKSKLRTKGFYLMPFIGGAALVLDRFKSLSQQAFVVLAGPIGGGVLAFLTFGLYLKTGIAFLGFSAYLMAGMNLFNLLPLSMMDGGQLMNTISYSINRKLGFRLQIISTVLAVIGLAFFVNPLIALVVGFLGYRSLKIEYTNRNGAFYSKVMNSNQMFLTGGCWILTAASLIWLLHQLKSFSIF